jgi:methionyl-tRNA synthetase
MKTFYITTTLPYVNAEPHIGFALEIVKADVIARWRRAQGEEVFFNTGVDEHGLKIYRQAQAAGLEPQVYCDQMAAKFGLLKEALNLSYNQFTRTTDESHVKAAQEFWRRSLAAGDIYKKAYRIKYCVGCELEKTESELVNGHCPLHPNVELELIDEENYFFRFSKYQAPLLKFYAKHPEFVLPAGRFNEIKSFVERGLEDFSISRLKAKMPWGVAVPDDEEQIMYVWFDALINYISCLGWPEGADFKKYWPGIQICGKDNLRQQTAMWQAMLMSVGLANSKQVLVNGFIGVDGVKMSKSLGNVVDPLALVKQYGTDAVRYYLLAEMNPFEDSDFSEAKFRVRYMSDLANGLGNLASRVASLAEKNQLSFPVDSHDDAVLTQDFTAKVNKFLFNEALGVLWKSLREADAALSQAEPWKMTEGAEIQKILAPVVRLLRQAGQLLIPLLPDTADKLQAQFGQASISKGEALFPRLD